MVREDVKFYGPPHHLMRSPWRIRRLRAAAFGPFYYSEMKFLLRHSYWLAPAIAFVGFISYFTVFVWFPPLRDVPWVNVPMVLLGVLLGVVGLLGGWKGSGWRRRSLYLGGALASVLIAGLLCLYIYSISYQMPPISSVTENLEKAPEFSLSDADGKMVALSDYRGKKVIISFYRGFW